MTLNNQETDRLQELLNIGIGKSANVLNKIVKSRVFLTVPKILFLQMKSLKITILVLFRNSFQL